MSVFDVSDPKDLVKIKEEMAKAEPELPCFMWKYLKELEARIEALEKL